MNRHTDLYNKALKLSKNILSNVKIVKKLEKIKTETLNFKNVEDDFSNNFKRKTYISLLRDIIEELWIISIKEYLDCNKSLEKYFNEYTSKESSVFNNESIKSKLISLQKKSLLLEDNINFFQHETDNAFVRIRKHPKYYSVIDHLQKSRFDISTGINSEFKRIIKNKDKTLSANFEKNNAQDV